MRACRGQKPAQRFCRSKGCLLEWTYASQACSVRPTDKFVVNHATALSSFRKVKSSWRVRCLHSCRVQLIPLPEDPASGSARQSLLVKQACALNFALLGTLSPADVQGSRAYGSLIILVTSCTETPQAPRDWFRLQSKLCARSITNWRHASAA